MKFSAVIVALIASTSQVEGTKLHSLQRAEAKAKLEAMSEQMELLQEQMDVNQKNMADTQAWWDTLYDDAQKLFWDWPLILRLENWIKTEGIVLIKNERDISKNYHHFSLLTSDYDWCFLMFLQGFWLRTKLPVL